MAANIRQFTVILEPESDGGYSVHCPALPGCVSQGDDRTSALANIEEAITLIQQEFGGVSLQECPDVVMEEIREVMQAQKEDGLPCRVEIDQIGIRERG